MRSNERIEARRRIIFDVRLSAQARLLYVVMDDLGDSQTGIVRQKQTTIAARIGFNRREVIRRLHELVEAGHLKADRTQRICHYELPWAQSRCATGAHQEVSDVQPAHIRCATGAHQEPFYPISVPGSFFQEDPPTPQRGDRVRCSVCRGRGQRSGCAIGSCSGCGGVGSISREIVERRMA